VVPAPTRRPARAMVVYPLVAASSPAHDEEKVREAFGIDPEELTTAEARTVGNDPRQAPQADRLR
jgi:hypothetical protein